MRYAKLIILGVLEGKLGIPLIRAAKDWGYEVLPVTSSRIGASSSQHERARDLVPGLQFLHPSQFDGQLAPVIDDQTLLVDASLDLPHGHLVERFAGFGAPLILLSESGSIREEVERDRVDMATKKFREAGQPVSVLQAPGYTQQGYSHIARLDSLPDYSLQGAGVIIELMSSGPCHLYRAIHERFRRLKNGELNVRDYSSQGAHPDLWEEIPREYHNYYQRVGYRIEREGSSERHELEFRGPGMFVEDFYRVLLPRFEALLQSGIPDDGLGLVRPEALPVK